MSSYQNINQTISSHTISSNQSSAEQQKNRESCKQSIEKIWQQFNLNALNTLKSSQQSSKSPICAESYEEEIQNPLDKFKNNQKGQRESNPSPFDLQAKEQSLTEPNINGFELDEKEKIVILLSKSQFSSKKSSMKRPASSLTQPMIEYKNQETANERKSQRQNENISLKIDVQQSANSALNKGQSSKSPVVRNQTLQQISERSETKKGVSFKLGSQQIEFFFPPKPQAFNVFRESRKQLEIMSKGEKEKKEYEELLRIVRMEQQIILNDINYYQKIINKNKYGNLQINNSSPSTQHKTILDEKRKGIQVKKEGKISSDYTKSNAFKSIIAFLEKEKMESQVFTKFHLTTQNLTEHLAGVQSKDSLIKTQKIVIDKLLLQLSQKK